MDKCSCRTDLQSVGMSDSWCQLAFSTVANLGVNWWSVLILLFVALDLTICVTEFKSNRRSEIAFNYL